MRNQAGGPSAGPGVPPGWEGAAERVYTITSADGSAVARVCPEIGGNTIDYAVRAGERWVHVLDVPPSPAVLRDIPSRYGLPILFPFPGSMRGGTYQWAGREHVVPPTYPTGSDPDGPTIVIHGFAHIRPWRFVEQGTDRIVLDFRTPESLDPARAASYPFKVRLTHELSLSADGLTSVLVAENQGGEAAPLAIGIHPYFGADVLGPDRSRVQVELPGRSVRAREQIEPGRPPAMTGKREPAPPGPVGVVPVGARMGVSRTDFETSPAVARMVKLPPIDGRDGWTIALAMEEGYRDALLFAPPVQHSISIEPYSHMPGNSSLPEGHPEGLDGLAPGERRTARATIRLVPPTAGEVVS
jgi:aldose 1-epimerase